MDVRHDDQQSTASCNWILITLGRLELYGAPPPPAVMNHAAWSVLAYMASMPLHHAIPRERLQYDVFGEAHHGAHMLRNAIYVLRKWLSDAIVVTRTHIAFASHVYIALDATYFMRDTTPQATSVQRMHALARYEGMFLVRPLYGWALETAHHIHERYLHVLQQMVDADTSGRSRWSLVHSAILVHERSGDIAVHERYIRLLAMHGQLTHARNHIAVARRYIEVLDADWNDRMERVVRYDQSFASTDQQQLLSDRLEHIPQIPLASRVMLTDYLELIWQRHLHGDRQFVVIVGPSGSGKTHVIQTCVPERFATRMVWLMRAPTSQAHDNIMSRLLALMANDPHIRIEVERVYETLSPSQKQSLSPPRDVSRNALVRDAHLSHQQRYDALIAGFTRFVADQPLIVIADDASLDLIDELHEVAHQIPNLMVIVTSDVSVSLPSVTVLSLPQVNANDVSTMLQHLLMQPVDPALRDAMLAYATSLTHVRTFMAHLVRTSLLWWDASADVWQYRATTEPLTIALPPLTVAAQQLIQLLAVIAEDVAVDDIVVKPWGYRRRIRQAVDELVAHQLVVRVANRIHIVDAVTRQYIIDALSIDERTRVHRWAMQSSAGITKATHAIVIGEVHEALHALLDIADVAWNIGDVRLLRRAYQLMRQLPQTNPDVQWLVAVNAVRMARFGEAPQVVRTAVAVLQQLSSYSSQRYYEALIGAGVSLRWAGYPRESVAILQRVFADAQHQRLPRLAFSAAHALTFAYLDCGDVRQSVAQLTQLYAPKTSIVSQVIVALTQSYVYARIADFGKADRAFHKIQRYRSMLSPRSSALVQYHAGIIAFARHDHEATVSYMHKVMTVMDEIGDVVTYLMAGSIVCLDYVRFGRFADAEHLAPTILERATSLQLLRQRLMALFGHMQVLAQKQLWSEAQALARVALVDAHQAGLLEYEATLVAFLLRVSVILEDDKQHALAAFFAVHQRMHDPHAMTWYHELAWFYLHEGNQPEALRWALYAESRVHTHTVGAVLPVSIIAMVVYVLQRCNHRQYLTTRYRAIDMLIVQLRGLRTAQARLDFIRGNRGMSDLMDVASLTTGDIVVMLPAIDAPRGRRLRDAEYVPVVWSGGVIRHQGLSLAEKIQQLSVLAEAQGATVMIRDLAKVLFVHERTVLRAIAHAAEHGVVIRTYRPRRLPV